MLRASEEVDKESATDNNTDYDLRELFQVDIAGSGGINDYGNLA